MHVPACHDVPRAMAKLMLRPKQYSNRPKSNRIHDSRQQRNSSESSVTDAAKMSSPTRTLKNLWKIGFRVSACVTECANSLAAPCAYFTD